MPQSHPTQAELSNYLDGQIADATVVESHLNDCLECCELAESLLVNSTISLGFRSLAELQPVRAEVVEVVANDDEVTPAAPPGYQIIDRIGRGGYGVVYKAKDLRLQRTVALKFARGAGLSDDGLTRFRREAKLAASLQHPNIVRVYDVMQQDGRPCLAMEFVSGGALDQWIHSTKPHPHAAAAIAAQIARAIHFAHTRGVVHRDLKPANILLEEPPADAPEQETIVPKVSDFGLARHTESNIYVTQAGTILGTPAYMSPEQVEGHKVSGSADVYSLGCILYEMLTLRPPFEGANTREQIRLVLEEAPNSNRSIDPSIPKDLDTICLKCLEKAPEARYGSAAELADDLDRFLDGYPVLARRIGLIESITRTCSRHPLTTLMAGALVTSILVAVAIVTLQWGETRRANDALLDANTDLEIQTVALSRTQDELAVELSSARRREEVSVFERGLKLAEAGEVGFGMLWMARSLEMSEAHAAKEHRDPSVGDERTDFQRMIRLNLTAWSDYLATRRIRYSEPLRSKAIVTPDAQHIFALAEDGLRRWKIDSDTSELWLDKPVAKSTPVAISRSGRTLLVAHDGAWRFVDNRTRSMMPPQIKPVSAVIATFFAGDSEDTVAFVMRTGSGAQAAVWRNDERLHSRDLPGLHPHALPKATISQNGQLLLVQVSDQRHLLRSDNLAPLREPIIGAVACPDALHSDSQSLWLASNASLLKQIDVRSGKQLREISVNPYRAWHHVTADGRTLLSGSAGGTVQRQDIQGNVRQSLLAMTGRVETICDHYLLLDGQELIELPKLTLRGSGRDSASVVKPDRAATTFDLLRRAAFDETGRRAIVINGGIGRLVDTADGSYIGGPLYPEPASRLHSGDISRDGKLAATGTWATAGLTPSNVTIWNAETGEKLFGPLRHLNYVSRVIFSPSGDVIAAGDYRGEIRLWNTKTGEPAAEPFVHNDIILSLDYSDDGRWLAAGSAHDHSGRPNVRVWNVESRKEYPTLRHQYDVSSVEFSKDGTILLTNDAHLRAWDWRTGTKLWEHLQQRCERFALCPDGNTLVMAVGDGSVRIMNLRTGKQEGRPILQEWPAESLAVHPNGKLLATGAVDGATRLWDLVTGKPVGPPVIQTSPIAAVDFDYEGESVVSVSLGAPPRTWAVPGPVEGTGIEVVERLNLQTGAKLVDDQTSRLDDSVLSSAVAELPSRSSPREQSVLSAIDAEQDGDWFAATHHLTNLIKLDGSDWSLFARRARARARLGDRDAASKDYGYAAELLAEDQAELVDWYKHCVADLRRIDAWEDSRWYLDRIIAAEPDQWRWYAQRAEALRNSNRDLESRSDQTKAIALCDDLNYVVPFLDSFANERRWSDALPIAKRLHRQFPDETPVAHIVALLQLKANRLDEHQASLHELVSRLQDGNANNSNDTAWACAVGKADEQDLKAVREQLEHAIDNGQFPSNELYAPLNTLALVAYRLADFESSIANCQKAIQANGQATEWEHQILRACYQAIGDDAAAAKQLAQAKRTPAKTESIWEQIELEIVRGLGSK